MIFFKSVEIGRNDFPGVVRASFFKETVRLHSK